MDFFKTHNISDDIIAVGVSGGADSLALALMLKDNGKKVVALTVNHCLRKEAQAEAEYVAKIMQKYGIEHHILLWKDGAKIKKGIEESARLARYDLMLDFCRKNKIKVLATAHHMRDQAETFLLRLQRGSGLFGLSSMLPVSNREGVILIRPLLDIMPEDLKKYCQDRKIEWIDDPMNYDDDFTRVKIRKFLPQLTKIGIDEKKLAETAKNLLNSRLFIQRLIDEFVSSQVRWWEGVLVSLNYNKLKELDFEISKGVLGCLLQKIGNTEYLPEVSEIMRVLEDNNFRGCTLGKCELFIASKRLWIIPQDEKNELMKKDEWLKFVESFPQYKSYGLPYKVRRALKQKLENKYG